MDSVKGSSLLETKRRNRILIKNKIFRTKDATRVGIANALGLTLPTITVSVNEMLQEHLLEEYPIDVSSSGAGRRPNAIRFRADAACAAGIELSPYAARALLLDMQGNILKKEILPPIRGTYRELLDQTSLLFEKLHPNSHAHLLGLGISLPGVIDPLGGVTLQNEIADWRNRPLASDLKERLGIRVTAGNNVQMRAKGFEMCMREEKDLFAYFFVSRGLACPIMIRDSMSSGYKVGTGEIGHSVLEITSGAHRREITANEAATEYAIFEKCQEQLSQGKCGGLQQILEAKGRFTMQDILELQKNGDEEINHIVSEMLDYCGIVFANFVNILNPEMLVVDGYIMSEEGNRKLFTDAVERRLFGVRREDLNILFRPYDEWNGASGAAYNVIDRFFLNV